MTAKFMTTFFRSGVPPRGRSGLSWVLLRGGGWLLAAAVAVPGSGFSPVGAQEGSASVVMGSVRGEGEAPLAAAAVTLRGPGASGALRRVATEIDGGFRFTSLAAGDYVLEVAHLGYAGQEREVSLGAGERVEQNFTLQVRAVELRGIDVRARRDEDRERARFETEAGVTARVVGGDELKLLPGLAEADVLRAVELLPGVISTSDFSSAFNVRGGSADQNLILLDGFPIFNPFHLGGLFSVFNPDALARAELLAGGFGAEYGGRVSSVLTVESRSDAEPGIQGAGGVSLLASRLLLRSAMPARLARSLGGDGGSWMVAARRSYFDKVLAPVLDFPYHLTDLQTHATVETRGGGHVVVTGYLGEDVLDLSDFTPPGDDEESILRVRWNWGNQVIGARWEQPVGDWVADTRLGFSRFAESLGFPDFADTRFRSRISQLSLRGDLARDFSPALSLRTGIEAAQLSYDNAAEAGGTSFGGSADRGTQAATYAALRWRPSSSWIVEPGLRTDLWWPRGTTRVTISPRFAVKRFFGPGEDAALKLAVGRYTQFLHSLRNEDFPLSNDVWVLADENVPAVVSDQIQLGLEKFWGDQWYASAEAYLRDFDGVTELNIADDPNDPADDLSAGIGRSYGLDFLVRRTAGRITGWATISFLRAEQTFPDPIAAGWEDLPPVRTFAPIYDRRLDMDFVVRGRLPWNVEAGARWNYGSPLPFSRPVSQYVGWEYDLSGGRFRPSTAGSARDAFPLFVVLGERNAERYPSYHRLDVTLRRPFQPRWGTLVPYLQVLNVYNQKNVLFFFYNYDHVPPTRSGFSMFPLLPTMGVEVSF